MQTNWIHIIGTTLVIAPLFLSPVLAADQALMEGEQSKLLAEIHTQDMQERIRAKFNSRFKEYSRFKELRVGDSEEQDEKSQRRAEDLGFADIRELKDVDVGNALPVARIQLDQIRAYQPGNDAYALLSDMEGAIVPVGPQRKLESIKLTVRSFVTLISSKKGKSDSRSWRIGPLVNLESYRSLIEARQELVNKEKRIESGCQCFGVHYEARGRYFLGYRSSSGEFRIKVLESGPGAIKKGQDLPAKEVFAELSKDAKKKGNFDYDLPGNPRTEWERFQKKP